MTDEAQTLEQILFENLIGGPAREAGLTPSHEVVRRFNEHFGVNLPVEQQPAEEPST